MSKIDPAYATLPIVQADSGRENKVLDGCNLQPARRPRMFLKVGGAVAAFVLLGMLLTRSEHHHRGSKKSTMRHHRSTQQIVTNQIMDEEEQWTPPEHDGGDRGIVHPAGVVRKHHGSEERGEGWHGNLHHEGKEKGPAAPGSPVPQKQQRGDPRGGRAGGRPNGPASGGPHHPHGGVFPRGGAHQGNSDKKSSDISRPFRLQYGREEQEAASKDGPRPLGNLPRTGPHPCDDGRGPGDAAAAGPDGHGPPHPYPHGSPDGPSGPFGPHPHPHGHPDGPPGPPFDPHHHHGGRGHHGKLHPCPHHHKKTIHNITMGEEEEGGQGPSSSWWKFWSSGSSSDGESSSEEVIPEGQNDETFDENEDKPDMMAVDYAAFSSPEETIEENNVGEEAEEGVEASDAEKEATVLASTEEDKTLPTVGMTTTEERLVTIEDGGN